jgi:hypothetical protein
METSGSPVAFAVGPGEAPELARLLDHEGPFVTVHLATEKSLDNAAQRSLQHWRPVRDALDAQDVPASTLDAIEALVPDAHHDGEGFFAVAAGGRVLLARGLPEAPDRDRGVVGALPAVLPLVEHRQRHRPHVLVVADRTGADILAFGPDGGEPTELTAGDNDPSDPAIRKSQPGGWSQRRYQERAERTWEDNAKAVAARVADVAQLIDPAAILVAGDVRAVAYLRDELHPRLAELVRDLDGARGADGSDDAIAEDARKQVATIAAAETVAILEKFKEERGQDDRAAEGLSATITRLNEAAVETLLVGDDPDDERPAWFSKEQPLVALSVAELEAYGVRDATQGRLLDVLVAAAFRTGARVRAVPRTVVADGVGAILRFRSDG